MTDRHCHLMKMTFRRFHRRASGLPTVGTEA